MPAPLSCTLAKKVLDKNENIFDNNNALPDENDDLTQQQQQQQQPSAAALAFTQVPLTQDNLQLRETQSYASTLISQQQQSSEATSVGSQDKSSSSGPFHPPSTQQLLSCEELTQPQTTDTHLEIENQLIPMKARRGRPKGSKNKSKN